MERRRSDPDALLREAQTTERRARRGRLKVFFGFAPGVGKTFAMLQSASRLAAQGVDVVIGIVETHGRSETEGLLLGLDILPRRTLQHGETTLTEFDLDAALARRPELILMDEMAHTNAPGSRHQKRWQDIAELLEAGIDVHSTMNVQHVETLNDIVAQITGVRVRETVPDSALEEAAEIELVDIPPDALLERLRQGKVYVPEMAEQALRSFFQKANLAALREMALRRTAAWVDGQVDALKREKGAAGAWSASERILVAIGPSPTSATLLRAARRMAASLRADLIAVFVETPHASHFSPADRDRLAAHMRLAESLGAEIVTLSARGSRAMADELLSYGRQRNVSAIVIGKPAPHGLLQRVRGSPVDRLIRAASDIDIHVVRGEPGDSEPGGVFSPAWAERRRPGTVAYAEASLVALAFLGLAWPLYRPPDLSTEAMLCLLGAALGGLWQGLGPGIVASAIAAVGYNFIFTQPRYSFQISSVSDVVTVTLMFFVGVVISALATTIRREFERSRERERRTAALYAMSRELAACRDNAEIMPVAGRHLRETFDASVAVLLARPGEPLRPSSHDPATPTLSQAVLGVARWCLDHGRPAGKGTTTLPSAPALCLPLVTARGPVGVIALEPHDAQRVLSTSQLTLLEMFAAQLALAIERAMLLEEAHAAMLRAESERLRSALLSSVSHDLRTPLAAIAGSAGALRDAGDRMSAATHAELVGSILDEAERLNRLISNLLFATRLESGAVEPRREWCSVEEIIGSAVARAQAALGPRRVKTLLPHDPPLIRVDPILIEQALVNLLENAGRHTPPDTTVELGAWREEDRLILQVADDGPGLPAGEERTVFQAFTRGSRGGHGGAGLGLAIAEGIARAHGGRAWAENRSPRGAAFKIALPIEAQPAAPPQPDARPATAEGSPAHA